MKRIINKPADFRKEALAGFASAHADIIFYDRAGKFIRRAAPARAEKVAVISGGGSGHEPMHSGYVGAGMLDAACPGEVFTSPTPDQMLAAADAVATGNGVLFVVKNYAGDIMNFEMASELVPGETATVLVSDDVGVDVSAHAQGRRGISGTIIVEKIVGAAAEAGYDLARCKAIGDDVNTRTASMAVALSGTVPPETGKPTFSLAQDAMELGVGIHGEAGCKTVAAMSADEIAHLLIDEICDHINPEPDEQLLLICNGLGGTPLIELYVLFHAAQKTLSRRGLTIERSLVGNYCTSLEMQGASLTLTRMNREMLQLWDAPVTTANLCWGKV